jgi:cysteine-rich repeat protein
MVEPGEFCDDGNTTSGDGCSETCLSEVSLIPGDANRDWIVDGVDFSIWAANLGKNVTPGDGADFNFDGMINADDYDVWLIRYGESIP